MKSPREVLLKKHEGAQRELDRSAREVVRQVASQRGEKPAAGWKDWLWPSPIGWGAVAAAWLVVIGFNIASRDPEPRHEMMAKRSPEMMQALREQRQLFVELVTPSWTDGEPIRRAPRPRSDRQQPFAMA
jgi:hypothetical protein